MCDAIIPPVEVVLRLVGSPPEVADIVQRHRTAVIKWRRRGDIPDPGLQRVLLTYARAHHIPLKADHLIFGATEAELAAVSAPTPVAAE